MALFIMLYKVVLTFESLDEILEFNHSNESFSLAVLILNFKFVDEIPQCDHSSKSY